jgi:hypothetical protein
MTVAAMAIIEITSASVALAFARRLPLLAPQPYVRRLSVFGGYVSGRQQSRNCIFAQSIKARECLLVEASREFRIFIHDIH